MRIIWLEAMNRYSVALDEVLAAGHAKDRAQRDYLRSLLDFTPVHEIREILDSLPIRNHQ
jgi:hypothetical protein